MLNYSALMPLAPSMGNAHKQLLLLFREWAAPHSLHFSRLLERQRRDGGMRGLGALDSDSHTLD